VRECDHAEAAADQEEARLIDETLREALQTAPGHCDDLVARELRGFR
jgi:hypothetical protein